MKMILRSIIETSTDSSDPADENRENTFVLPSHKSFNAMRKFMNCISKKSFGCLGARLRVV